MITANPLKEESERPLGLSREQRKLAPVHRIARVDVVSRVPEVLRLCAGKRVLHLGCADYPYTEERGEQLLHRQLLKIIESDDLWGFDSSHEGLRHMRRRGFENLLEGDLELELPEALNNKKFDVILAGEMFEHLNNPGLALKNLVGLMSEDTELVITVPNATSLKTMFYSLFQKVQADHNYYFSFRTLRQLLTKHGLEYKAVSYYQTVEGSGLSRIFDRVTAAIGKISPAINDGLIVQAVLSPGAARPNIQQGRSDGQPKSQ